MNNTIIAACVLGVAVIAASIAHGGLYTVVPAANSGDRPGLIYVVNKYTGTAVKWCVPRGCSELRPELPDFTRR